ncbi:AAA family ATPase [uncultured Sutterella sp.]|uniref:AAA family ATPase n=1 Tax=uncultured Sutterella sp. TaxID=286133 RepID=UPI0026236D69|nr:AAA family ATPase [uncultured Sutterella sp.]
MSLPKLPLTASSFPTLRSARRRYVDKTDLIHQMASRGRGKFLLARPSGFGKSLLLSVFESLFEHGLKDFQGLEIERLWRERTYPVLRLDFSSMSAFETAEAFHEALGRMMKDAAGRAGVELPKADHDPIGRFSSCLAGLKDAGVVVLIDDFDAPLLAHPWNAALSRVVCGALNRIFAALKSYEGGLRFCAITSTCRFRNEIFPGLNAFDDISLNPRFAALTGFTREEIRETLGDHLASCGQALNLSPEETMRAIEELYGGFSFDETARLRVCSPRSVLQFLEHPETCWKNNGLDRSTMPPGLMRLLKSRIDSSAAEILLGSRPADLAGLKMDVDIREVPLDALLLYAGFLTVREGILPGIVELGSPNREAEASFERLCAGFKRKLEN